MFGSRRNWTSGLAPSWICGRCFESLLSQIAPALFVCVNAARVREPLFSSPFLRLPRSAGLGGCAAGSGGNKLQGPTALRGSRKTAWGRHSEQRCASLRAKLLSRLHSSLWSELCRRLFLAAALEESRDAFRPGTTLRIRVHFRKIFRS